jgi:cell wall-associated NlpC family hydrolase
MSLPRGIGGLVIMGDMSSPRRSRRPRPGRFVPVGLAVALTAGLIPAALGAGSPVVADEAQPPAVEQPAPPGDEQPVPAAPEVPVVETPAVPPAEAPVLDNPLVPPAPLSPSRKPKPKPQDETSGGASAGSGDGVPAEQQGGGALPGERPTSDADAPTTYADAAPPLEPGFVDDYTRLWKRVEKGKVAVREIRQELAGAQQVLSDTTGDLVLALRVRNRADFAYGDAAQQFDVAVKDLYMQGTTDVDVLMGVLGSKPEDVLRNIDAVVYLRSATGMEAAEYTTASAAAVVAQSTAASAMIQADAERTRVDRLTKRLEATRKQLDKDQKELQALIAAAAPQTVVGGNGCPKAVLEGTVPEGVNIKQLCNIAVRSAATPQAAFAIKWALVRLGAPYACEGIGRLEPWRYDCSSYVSRAYSEGAGLKTAGDGWAPSTRNMVPWDGAALDPHYAVIPPNKIRPGDLALYDTCPAGEVCPYRHVVMYLGPAEPGGVPLMAHTNACGDVAHVTTFPGTNVPNFLGVRRVIPAYGEKVLAKAGAFEVPIAAAQDKKKPKKPSARD